MSDENPMICPQCGKPDYMRCGHEMVTDGPNSHFPKTPHVTEIHDGSDENQQLKPCEVCKSDRAFVSNRYHSSGSLAWFTQCASCEIRTTNFKTANEAIAAWNVREAWEVECSELKSELTAAKARIKELEDRTLPPTTLLPCPNCGKLHVSVNGPILVYPINEEIPTPSPTIPAALLEKLEGALKRYSYPAPEGYVDNSKQAREALAELQAFRNGGAK